MKNRTFLSMLAMAGLLASFGCSSGRDTEAQSEEAVDQVPSEMVGGPFLLVVNKSSNTLSVVDPATEEIVADVETGFAPHEVAVSADGRFAYVTDYGTGSQPGNTITVVDLHVMGVSGTISLEPHTRPHGIEIAPDGTLWVTTEGSAHVLQVDAVSGRILKAIETGQRVTHMVAVAPEAGRVVTANIGSGNATIVDPETESVVAHVETGAGAEGLTIHPDGMHAFVTNRAAGTLVEIDLTSGAVTRSMDVGDFPIRVKVRPGGAELLVSNANANEVAAVDPESWEVIRRLPVGAAPIGILITPDNEMAYVANTQDDKVTVIDLVAWEVAGEIATGDEPDGMAWVAGG
jgi:YVTN family beta-propeller protein